MKIQEIHVGYRVQFENLEEVVIARVTDLHPNLSHLSLPQDDAWVVMTAQQVPCTRADLEKWQHVYRAPEEAVQHSIDRAREDMAANEAKIARLSAALAHESEASK